MLCIIYLLLNKINGMYYIGQTWNTLEERWESGHGYKGCPHIDNAIKKYGKDNFHYEVLAYAYTQEQADELEDAFIVAYDSRNKKRGYNIKQGGSNGKMSEESKKKLSNSMKGGKNPNYGKPRSEETKKRISEAKTGVKLPPHTDEHNRKISEAKKGVPRSEETIRKMSEGMKGRKPAPMSEEAKEQSRIRNTGKKMSDEVRAKMREAWKIRKTKPESDETRAKRSASRRSMTWTLVDGKRVYGKRVEDDNRSKQ